MPKPTTEEEEVKVYRDEPIVYIIEPGSIHINISAASSPFSTSTYTETNIKLMNRKNIVMVLVVPPPGPLPSIYCSSLEQQRAHNSGKEEEDKATGEVLSEWLIRS